MRSVGRIAVIAWVGLAMGCGPTVGLDEGGAEAGEPPPASTSNPGTSTSPSPTTTPPDPSTTTTSTPTTAPLPEDDSSDDDAGDFIVRSDPYWPSDECDVLAQDCPRGEKCMPWANDGGNSWNATRCSEIDDDPGAPGDPCSVEGSGVSGIDSCGLGVMCWDVDPETNEGICVEMCSGTEDNPTCSEPGTTCLFSNGPIYLCLSQCDPINQDCRPGEACYPLVSRFSCLDDGSGGAAPPGTPCDFINSCNEGSFCASDLVVPDCQGLGCCTSFCLLGDPLPPCLPGQVCTPYYEDGFAPPGYEMVGACALP